MATGFYHDERCLWHTTGEQALFMQVGGWLQPMAGGGQAENPETKRWVQAKDSPFWRGGYEIAALSAGLVKRAVSDILRGAVVNAYALSRPPGHYCLPDADMLAF